ncbi:MAG: flagellar basal body-associated FliL family protein [Thermoguttaceae bacterium]
MAPAAKIDPDDVPEVPQVQPVQGRSRMIIALALGVLILFELIFFAWIMPKSKQTAEVVENDIKNNIKNQEIVPNYDPDVNETPEPGETVEVPLPDPIVCDVTSQSGDTTCRVNAKFVFMVNKKDEKKFNDILTKTKNRITAVILEVLRTSSKEDLLDDPKVSRIQRRIQVDVNKLLQEPYVKQVINTDFRVQVN